MTMTMPSPMRLLMILTGLIVLGGAGFVLWQQQGRIDVQQGTIAALQHRLRQAQSDAEALQGQLTQADAEQRKLTERVAAGQKELEQAQEGLRAVQVQLVDWSSRYSALQQEKETLAGQLTAAAKERDEAKQQLAQLQTHKIELDHLQQELQQRVAALTSEVDRVKRSASARAVVAPSTLSATGAIQLPSIVVRGGGNGEPPAGVHAARVLDVNASYRFIVIDEGGDDGVLPGMVFDVLRDSTTIGSVTATQVRDHLAACDVDVSSTPSSFQVGDAAVPRRH